MTEETVRLLGLLKSGEALQSIESKLDGIAERRSETDRRLDEVERELRELRELKGAVASLKVSVEGLSQSMDRRRLWQEQFWQRTLMRGGLGAGAFLTILGILWWLAQVAPHVPPPPGP